MALFKALRNHLANGWKIEPPVSCPNACVDCPVFKSFDVYNQKRGGRAMRVRNYLAKSAIGYSDFVKTGVATVLLPRLSQQAFALMQNDAIVDPNCTGPRVETTLDGAREYECLGVFHANSRSERLGLD